MAHRSARAKVLAIGVGALLGPVLAPAAASADPDHRGRMTTAPLPPTGPVASESLARGAAGEFRIKDAETGVLLRSAAATDVAMVKATLPPRTSTPWHEHEGPSMVVVASGALRMVEPDHKDHRGCSEETFSAGTAFGHPSAAHAFANDGSVPAVFYIVYFVPEGGSPAPIVVDAPSGC